LNVLVKVEHGVLLSETQRLFLGNGGGIAKFPDFFLVMIPLVSEDLIAGETTNWDNHG
jgi:hypothetical protein